MRKFKDLKDWEVDKETLYYVNKFRFAGIGLRFIFTITENNNKTGNASFRMPFTGGTCTIGLKAGSEKARANERIVNIVESFSDLVLEREDYCIDAPKPRKHWVYPITGNIGLAEVIGTYITIVDSTKVVGTFTDKLTFTTKLFGGVKPEVVLSQFVPKKLRIASADIDVNADRTDVHEVRIAITDTRSEPTTPVPTEFKLSSGITLTIPLPESLATRVKPGIRPPVSRKSGRFFGISKPANRSIYSKTLNELDRLDSLDTTRRLKDIIGK